jgi:hypothetical protein
MSTKDEYTFNSSNDFGFSAVSEEELKTIERELEEKVANQEKELEMIEQTYKGKLEQLYKTVMPLLENLTQSPEKGYLYWPDRSKKMKDFIKKVNSIVND